MRRAREVVGWCLFDVANSAYTTLIITVAYNVIFTKLVVGTVQGTTRGNTLWAWTLAASWACAAFLGPWLGSVSDARAARKKMLAGSVALCCAASAALYFVTPGQVTLAIALVLLSNLGFSLSENFIAAFLPSLAKPSEMGRLSGLAWGLGYFGGLISILLAQAVMGLDYRLENWSRIQWIGPLTAAFFFLGALPALGWLREPPVARDDGRVFARLGQTWNRLRQSPRLLLLLVSCFFFQGALAIVISFAAIYGEQVVGLTGGWQAVFFLSLQLTAAGGAFFFGWLQSRWDGLRTLDATLYVWLGAIAVIVALPALQGVFGWTDLRIPFLLAGNLAGLCLGATQSVARALIGQMAPVDRSGEIFGLWGFSGKLAMVFALFFFGLLQEVVGLRHSLLFCAGLFGVSLVLHHFIRRTS